MSLLFNLVAKLSVEEGEKARFLSYPRKTPYLLADLSIDEDESSNDEENVFASYWVFNPRSEKIINITGKKFPRVLYDDGCMLLGTSRGWEVFMRMHDSTIHLSQVCHPWSSSDASLKTIALPPFNDHFAHHSYKAINVSLSSPFPHQDEDYIVSVTFLGSKLIYCMPNRDSEWTNINIPFSCEKPRVVYSRKDQMLYLLPTGCAYLAALDVKKNKKNPNFLRLHFESFPSIPQHEWEILVSCLRSDYMVESFSGERFIVQWYVEPASIVGDITRLDISTKRFMVFLIKEVGRYEGSRVTATYTEYIGDLCIFVGQNETFCLEASKFPGLRPNSIYYAGYGFGIYDISRKSSREYDISGFPTTRIRTLFLSPSLY